MHESEARRYGILIFASAVAIRWIYILLIYRHMGISGLVGADSVGYLELGRDLAEQARGGLLHGYLWLGQSPSQMPLFTWLLAASALLWDAKAALGFVLVQSLLDAGTCVLIYGIASTFGTRIAAIAGFAAALNPTQIVLSGLVYSDTAFLFFMTLSFHASLCWLKNPTSARAIAIGLWIGLAAMIRITAATWLPFLAAILLFLAWRTSRLNRGMAVQLALAAAIAFAFLVPVVGRNAAFYGSYLLTPQGGEHLARHVVPVVRELADGTPRATTVSEIDRRRHERYGEMPSNIFVQSSQYSAIGRSYLDQIGFAPLLKAWIVGAAVNLGTPAIILSPPVAQLPRTGFFMTAGDSTFEKMLNFVFRPDNANYGLALLLGTAGLAIVRLVQVYGAFAERSRLLRWPGTLLFACWIGYILLISGPIASPKYRLPIEPPLAILFAMGLQNLPAVGRRTPRKN